MPLEHSPRVLRSGRQIANVEDQNGEVNIVPEAIEPGQQEVVGDFPPIQLVMEDQDRQNPEDPIPEAEGIPAQNVQDRPGPDPPAQQAQINMISAGSSTHAEVSSIYDQMRSLVVQTPKETPRFDGKGDGADWLKAFNRTCLFNGHSDVQKLRAIPFSLTNVAADWFDNVGEDLDSWSEFETAFRKRFVSTIKRAEAAREKLNQIVFQDGQAYTTHLETVVKLCRQIDQRMTDAEIIRKFAKTLSPLQATIFLSKNIESIDKLREHTTNLDETLPFVNDKASVNAVTQAKSPVRARSPARHVSWGSDRPTTPERRPGTATTRSPVVIVPDSQYQPNMRAHLQGNRRNSANQALCNWCNRPGHVLKHCLNRIKGYLPVQPNEQNQGN